MLWRHSLDPRVARHAAHRPCVELVVGTAGFLGFEAAVMQLSEHLDLRAPDPQLQPCGRIIVGTECVERRWAKASTLPTVVLAHTPLTDTNWPWIELSFCAETPTDDAQTRDLASRAAALFVSDPIDPGERLTQRLAELGEDRGPYARHAMGALHHLADEKDVR